MKKFPTILSKLVQCQNTSRKGSRSEPEKVNFRHSNRKTQTIYTS